MELKRKYALLDSESNCIECPLCFERLSPPVYQCENGHIACTACREKLRREECPYCRSKKVEHSRNLALEKILDSLVTSCKYSTQGCKAMLKIADTENHENDLCECRFGVPAAIRNGTVSSVRVDCFGEPMCRMSTDTGGAQLGSGSSNYGPAGTLLESPGASKVPAGIGVTYHKMNEKYEAHLWLAGRQHRNMRKKKGVQLFLGHFATADEAKRAHDKAALKIRKTAKGKGKVYQINFPESDYTNFLAEHSGWSERDFFWKIRRSSFQFSMGKSSMKGVTVRTSTRKGVERVAFEAKISHKGDGESKKQFNLGMFESEEMAGKAYDRALLYLHGPDELTSINFRPSDYSEGDIQGAGMMIQSQYSCME